MVRKYLTLCLFYSCLLSKAFAEDKGFTKELETLITENNLPGIVLLVKQGNDILHYRAHGKVNTEAEKDMQRDAIFRLFSMSKPITAFAVLQLVDQGKLSLNDDIRQYLPSFKPFEHEDNPQTVTVHQLLTHTAGMGYGGGLKSWPDIQYLIFNPLSRSNSLQDLIDDISGIELKFPPGSQWHYSIASDVQGALIEAVSGMTLDKYFHKYIFQPLEMKDTGFVVPSNDKQRLVDMYEYDADGLDAAKHFNPEQIDFIESGPDSEYLEMPELLSGGGGLVSTASDYSNFVSTLLNKGLYKGKRLLSEAMVQKMLTSHTQGLDTWFLPKIHQDTGFGYGLAVKENDKGLRKQGSFYWAGMGGTLFWGDPQADLQVIAMMQVEDGWIALDKWLVPRIYEMLDARSNPGLAAGSGE